MIWVNHETHETREKGVAAPQDCMWGETTEHTEYTENVLRRALRAGLHVIFHESHKSCTLLEMGTSPFLVSVR